jgi:hypothetical protein
MWGCQALRFPADMLGWLADHDWMQTFAGRVKMGSDTILGTLIGMHPKRNQVAVHIPCLVQHVGRESACFPGIPITPRRSATNFRGLSFDAMSLPPFLTLVDPPDQHSKYRCV